LRGGARARIPVRRAFDSCVAPGLMLIGDSACMANPLNGSGITSAMWAAHLAAKTALRALANDRVDTGALWPYNAAYKRTQDAKFAQLHLLLKMLVAEPREHFHEFVKRGIFAPTDFWDIEDLLNPADNLHRLPKILTLMDHPAFFARMSATFALMKILEQHYLNYPLVYRESTFRKWREGTMLLFKLVPRHGHGLMK
jgi:flavin-dependent dehydrogenase